MRILPEEFFYHFLHFRHAGHTTDQDYFVDVVGGASCIFECIPAGLHTSFYKIFNQLFKCGPGDFDIQMFWTRSIRGNERKVDFSF